LTLCVFSLPFESLSERHCGPIIAINAVTRRLRALKQVAAQLKCILTARICVFFFFVYLAGKKKYTEVACFFPSNLSCVPLAGALFCVKYKYLDGSMTIIKYFDGSMTICETHGKNDFAEKSKILAGYRSEK